MRYVQGSALDVDDLARGLAGAEVFVNMLMKSPQGGVLRDQTLTEIRENYETNTLALHLLLLHSTDDGDPSRRAFELDDRPLPVP